MKIFRIARLMVLALLVSLIPMSSFAGVFISVSFAPPILPVYEQPPCPEPGLMWTPGYWAYDEDGYYWVPGTWVPVPFEGALWTPPYWGWDGGLYMFHPGYWGMHVGYYGGVNYGFGYMGIGFVGGMWRGHDFVYNTAVMRVDERYVHTTYIDRTIVERNTIVNDRRVAFSGGRDGIHHDPAPEERFADRDRHMDPTSYQHAHESAAMSDKSLYVRNNGGHPGNPAVQRPLGNGGQGSPSFDRNKSGHDAWSAPGRAQQNAGGGNQGGSNQGGNGQGRGNYNPPSGGSGGGRGYNNAQPGNGNNQNRNFGNAPPNNPGSDSRGFNNPQNNPGNQPPHPAPEFRQIPQGQPQIRQMPQPQPRPEPQLQARPQPQMRPAPPPPSRPQPEFRQAPQLQSRPAPQAQQQARPAPQEHGQGQNKDDRKDHQH